MPVSLPEDLKRQERQNKLIAELFDTEASYLAPLEAFIAATDDNPLYSDNKVIQQQRIEIKNMILLSKELLRLTDDMKVLPNLAQVAEFFNNNDQFFKIYEPYAATYTDYTQELLKGKNEKNIGENINTALQSKNTTLNAHSIAITPIQRIPRYVMLLKAMVETDTINSNLSATLTKIQRRAFAINEAIKTKEQQVNAKSFLKKTRNKLIQKAIENKTGTEIEIILKYAQEINNLKKNRKFYNKNSKDYDTLIKQVENLITLSFTGEKEDRIKPNHKSILEKLVIASQSTAATQTLRDTQNTIKETISFQLMIQQLKETPREEAKKNPATADQALLQSPPGIMLSRPTTAGSKAKPDSKAAPAKQKEGLKPNNNRP